MKRHYIYIGLTLALLTGSVSDANAQGFLKKAMQKAAEAKEKLQDKVGSVVSGVTGIDMSDDDSSSETVSKDVPAKNTATDVVAKRRASTVSWDAPVTPSSASTPMALLNELPAVPTVEQIANPTEEDQIRFYQAIKKVTLRAEALNVGGDACEDAWLEEWRLKYNERLAKLYGLTPEEMNKLDDPNTPEAERERLQKKMEDNMRNKYNLGSEEDMEARAAELEARMATKGGSEALAGQMAIKSIEKMRPFYNENESEIKYLTGMSATEYYNANIAQAKYSIAHPNSDKLCPEMKTGMDYADAARKKEGKPFTTREQAFQKKVQAAMQKAMKEAQSDMTGGAASMADVMGLGNLEKMAADMANASADATKLQQGMLKLAEMEAPLQEALQFDGRSMSESLSKENYKKIEDLRKKICATDDPEKYNALYNEAGALIANFRQNAAKKYRTELQKRIDKVKAQMPALIKAQQQAVKDELIPACAVNRSPLNAVISTADMLNETYSFISEAYPSLVCTTVYQTYTLVETEHVYYPENYVGIGDDAQSLKLYVKDEANKNVYQLVNGKKQKVTESDFKRAVLTPIAKTEQQQDRTWTSTDGKRKAYYNAQGGILQLPEGEVINSYEMKSLQAEEHLIIWFSVEHEEGKINILKHVYKI